MPTTWICSRGELSLLSSTKTNTVNRTITMPRGRVAERVQALQNERQEKLSAPKLQLNRPKSTTFDPASSTVSLTQKTEPQHVARNELIQDTGSNTTQNNSASSLQEEDRGRSETPVKTQHSTDEALEDVRARLYSVQRIVKHERSGSPQARDEVMDELDSMIDSAIATTMTPLPSPRLPPRAASSGRAARPRPQSSASSLTRSQSLKSHHKVFSADPASSSARTVSTLQPPPQFSCAQQHLAIPTRLISTQSKLHRSRQASEPASIVARRTGFPLTSPVRERALL